MSARRPDRPAGPARSSSSVRPGSTPARVPAKPRGPRAPANTNSAPSPRPHARGPQSNPTPAVASRDSVGAIWPRVLTVRALVLVIVLLLAFVMLFPTVRGFLGQRSNLQAMRADVVAAQEREDELEFQLGRWNDDAYVASQARERLAYVYPGETAFRVLDPESVVPEVDPDTGKTVADGPVDVHTDDAPWYAKIWKSVELSDQVPSSDEAAPADKSKK